MRRDDVAAAGPPSYTEALERAKDLYRRGVFPPAIRLFTELAGSTAASAPDLWIEATYGLAEIHRLRGELRPAANLYRRLLDVAGRRPPTVGRYAHSNRMSTLYAYLGLVIIGRHSLQCRVAELDELIAGGEAWSARVLEHTSGTADFKVQRALLARNVDGPQLALAELHALAHPGALAGATFFDGSIVGVWAREAEVDLGRPWSAPPALADDHYAAAWIHLMDDLLAARSALGHGRVRDARAALARAAERRATLACHPELELGLACLAATVDPAVETRDVAEDLLARAFARGLGEGGELSHALWWQLFTLQHGSATPAGRARVAELLRLSAVAEAVVSRRVDEPLLCAVLTWCARGGAREPATSAALATLARAVRP